MDEAVNVSRSRGHKKFKWTIENVINRPDKAWEDLKPRLKKLGLFLLPYVICVLAGIILASCVWKKRLDTKIVELESAHTEYIATIAETQQKEATNGQKISLYRNVARALYGIRDYGLSNDAKRAYIPIMLNRANPNVQYDVMRGTDDLASVLAVPNQWQGYKQDGNYTEADYQLVKEFLESESGNILNSDKYFWCEIKQGYIICKADINGKTSIPDQVVQ